MFQAVWAVRHNDRFEDVLVAAIELGGDTDTVATVAGAIAGARDSVQAIPSRWLTYINGDIETPDGIVQFDNASLQDFARALIGRGPVPVTAPEPAAGPRAWTGRTGLVHEAALAELADLANCDVYASGPPAMVEAIRHSFVERGLPRAQLFFDSFDYAPDTLAAMRSTDAG